MGPLYCCEFWSSQEQQAGVAFHLHQEANHEPGVGVVGIITTGPAQIAKTFRLTRTRPGISGPMGQTSAVLWSMPPQGESAAVVVPGKS